jgi:hypothetical protein
MPRPLARLLVACGVLTCNIADAADAVSIHTSELQLRSTMHALPQVPRAVRRCMRVCKRNCTAHADVPTLAHDQSPRITVAT